MYVSVREQWGDIFGESSTPLAGYSKAARPDSIYSLLSSKTSFSDKTLDLSLVSLRCTMFSLHAPVVFLCAFAEFSKAVVLLGSPSITADSYLTTPAPIPLHAYELGKRQNAPDFCGSNEDYGSITCYAPSLTCKGTILPNHKAYQYCLTPGLANQIVYTTGLTNYNGGACDSSTACWYAKFKTVTFGTDR